MKNFVLIIALLIFCIACSNPRYKIETLTNDYNDTLYVVSQLTTSHVYVSDVFWYESIYQSHDKDSAWTFYKKKIKEYEEILKRKYK